MRYGSVPLNQANGARLAHARRLPDGSRLSKGHALVPSDLEALSNSGVESVTVFRLDPDDVAEDEAAHAIAELLSGPGTKIRPATTGRSNIVADVSGLVQIHAGIIDRLNRVNEAVTVSTLRPDAPVRRGSLVATVKIVPFATSRTVLEACQSAAKPSASAVQIQPFRRVRTELVLTEIPGMSTELLVRSEEAMRVRLGRTGNELDRVHRCRHDDGDIERHLVDAIGRGADLVLVLGASAVGDRSDVLPEALRRAGGETLRLGIPVDPGNLTLIGALSDRTILGVPGCARSTRRNGFDWVLERVLTGADVRTLEVAALGVGGLLKEPAQRPQPRREVEEPETPSLQVAGVVLAAGQSKRMGEANKLLEPVLGEPMVRRVVRTALDGGLDPVIVVLGHQEAEVRESLHGLPVQFVWNPEYQAGMGTSVGCGIGELGPDAAGAMILLGDMPWVSPEQVKQLTRAFSPNEDRGICVPMVRRKRGNPIVWAARYFHHLKALDGDIGARHLLSEYDLDVCEVQMSGDEVLRDIDTLAALADAARTGG